MTCPRKRVLFVMPPGYGHVFPLIPLAWAFRAAGHDVAIASCGVSLQAATRAGLPAINVLPTVDLAGIQRRYTSSFRDSFGPLSHDAEAAPGQSIFPELCDLTADGVVEAALSWQPRLIVYTPEAPAALIAATKHDIPAVFVAVGLDHTPTMMVERYAATRPTWHRHGLPALRLPTAWVDLTPPSLRASPSNGWPMRYVQYNGGHLEALPKPLSDRPCIAVTLGTIVPLVTGLKPLASLAEVAAEIDATFVVTLGTASAAERTVLPPNVIIRSWVPLDALLAHCQAAIHHGGFGTSLAMLSEGLPQVVLPQGADQFHNALALQRRGVAVVAAEGLTTASVRRVLDEPSFRQAAHGLRAEIAEMPPPASLIPRLLAIAA